MDVLWLVLALYGLPNAIIAVDPPHIYLTVGCVEPGLVMAEHLKQLDGWEELPLGEQSVDLPHKLESDIILIQDEGIRVLNDDGDLPTLEEDLELLPVVLLLLVVLRVLKRVHLDVLREVTRENLCNQEPVVERPKKLGAKHTNTF